MRLADGRTVEVRPILPTDADELGEAIRTADPDTIHRRFLGSPPPVTPELLTHLTVLDYRTRFALVAHAGDFGVALARYESTPDRDGAAPGERTAEVAVAVRREWRGVGLATELVRLLARRAQECGITRFSALYSATNRPVEELAREAHAHVVIDSGSAELDAPI